MTKTTDEQLKPCPFCGGSRRSARFYQRVSDDPAWAVKCRECAGGSGTGNCYDNKDLAAVAWNSRDDTRLRELSAEVERLRDELNVARQSLAIAERERDDLRKMWSEMRGSERETIAELRERLAALWFCAPRPAALQGRAEKAERECAALRETIKHHERNWRAVHSHIHDTLPDGCFAGVDVDHNSASVIAAIDQLDRECNEAIAALPSSSGRDENRAGEALGKVMRHGVSDTSSLGVVNANKARLALVSAYAEANTLRRERDEARGGSPLDRADPAPASDRSEPDAPSARSGAGVISDTDGDA